MEIGRGHSDDQGHCRQERRIRRRGQRRGGRVRGAGASVAGVVGHGSEEDARRGVKTCSRLSSKPHFFKLPADACRRNLNAGMVICFGRLFPSRLYLWSIGQHEPFLLTGLRRGRAYGDARRWFVLFTLVLCTVLSEHWSSGSRMSEGSILFVRYTKVNGGSGPW